LMRGIPVSQVHVEAAKEQYPIRPPMRQMARNSQQSDFGGRRGSAGLGSSTRLWTKEEAAGCEGPQVCRRVEIPLVPPHLQCLVLETQELALGEL